MRKTMMALGAAALLAASSLTSFAEEETNAVKSEEATGSITAIDPGAMTVTLDNGSTYKLDPALNPASLQVGQKVRFEYTTNTDGSLSIIQVEPAPAG
jgi:hypothetical protein